MGNSQWEEICLQRCYRFKGGNILFHTILFWPLRSVYITWVLVHAQKMHNGLTEKRHLLTVLSKPSSLNWQFGKHLLAFAWNQYWLVGFANICIIQCCNHSQVFTVQCTLWENGTLLLSLYFSMYLSLYFFIFVIVSAMCIIQCRNRPRAFSAPREKFGLYNGPREIFVQFHSILMDWLIDLYQINRSHSWPIDQIFSFIW